MAKRPSLIDCQEIGRSSRALAMPAPTVGGVVAMAAVVVLSPFGSMNWNGGLENRNRCQAHQHDGRRDQHEDEYRRDQDPCLDNF